jgi:hypothetical protein
MSVLLKLTNVRGRRIAYLVASRENPAPGKRNVALTVPFRIRAASITTPKTIRHTTGVLMVI